MIGYPYDLCASVSIFLENMQIQSQKVDQNDPTGKTPTWSPHSIAAGRVHRHSLGENHQSICLNDRDGAESDVESLWKRGSSTVVRLWVVKYNHHIWSSKSEEQNLNF